MTTDPAALDAIARILTTNDDHLLDALRETVAATGRAIPSVRRVLDLSTSHVPPGLVDGLADHPHIVADMTPFGAWLWVPDDFDEPDASPAGAVPDYITAVYRYATSWGCAWVLLDADTAPVNALPTFDWP